MSFLEGIIGVGRYAEKRQDTSYRSPGIVILEFGGGGCNKAYDPSCRDFCAVPSGKHYNPSLDPPVEMVGDLFKKVVLLKPAVVSLVPNGETVDMRSPSNTGWNKVLQLYDKKLINKKQFKAFREYYFVTKKTSEINPSEKMKPGEKIALTIATGVNSGLNVLLTSNGSYLNEKLLKLYSLMGLQTINLSYHPSSPFDPERYNPDLEHLIMRAEEAIDHDITPTITHVLNRKNAETFVALADYVSEHDILFAVGLAQGKGMAFSADNRSIEPTSDQVKTVFTRLLARRLYSDRHIRTTMPYLIMAPFIPNWVCSQSTDFFHISVEMVDGKLQSRLNVCSEVRPEGDSRLENFLKGGDLDIGEYLQWRNNAMRDPENGCPSCINQCYFEVDTRKGVDMFNTLEGWDYFDTVGKAFRQRYTFRHPIRPNVHTRKDFQNPYMWESIMQGITRFVASLSGDQFWQETFKRSGVDYDSLVERCLTDCQDKTIISRLVEAEKKDYEMRIFHKEAKPQEMKTVTSEEKTNWHDNEYWQSKLFRALYLMFQKSGREAGLPSPIRFSQLLDHQSHPDLRENIVTIVEEGKRKSIIIRERHGRIFPFISTLFIKRNLSYLNC